MCVRNAPQIDEIKKLSLNAVKICGVRKSFMIRNPFMLPPFLSSPYVSQQIMNLSVSQLFLYVKKIIFQYLKILL